jgi:hypothetical protein
MICGTRGCCPAQTAEPSITVGIETPCRTSMSMNPGMARCWLEKPSGIGWLAATRSVLASVGQRPTSALRSRCSPGTTKPCCRRAVSAKRCTVDGARAKFRYPMSRYSMSTQNRSANVCHMDQLHTARHSPAGVANCRRTRCRQRSRHRGGGSPRGSQSPFGIGTRSAPWPPHGTKAHVL